MTLCGTYCEECDHFQNQCQGCESIQGKVYWAPYVGKEICPIYDCCINQRKLSHCGQCLDLPCHIYYDTQDPSLSKEEHDLGVIQRTNELKKRK